MNLRAYIANLLFRLLNNKAYHSLHAACSDPETTQKKILFSILRENAETEYGRKYDFRNIKTIKDFQERVPLTTYEDYVEHIKHIMQGQSKVLSETEVAYFALSSGSSSASKYIPYTSSLKAEFSRALIPWINDLLKDYPKLRSGKQFWIITPNTLPEDMPSSKIPIGFEEDQEYFQGPVKSLIRSVMSLPGNLRHTRDPENYYYMLSWCLLREKDLRLISVWNPGLLINIMDFIAKHFKALSYDISEGELHLPHPEISSDKAIAGTLPSGLPHRGRFLSGLQRLSPSTTRRIWPRLCLISCWTDAWAASLIEEVRQLFPGVDIQGKGLLATEGVVSIPLLQADWPLLTINAQFYEFLSLKDNQIYLASSVDQ